MTTTTPPVPAPPVPTLRVPAVPVPVLHVPADAQHGVTIYARRLAEQLGVAGVASPAVGEGALHVHFTDRLWGSDPADAAAVFEAVGASRRVTVTLHDLPQPSDGERNLPRRTDCYRRVVGAAAGVVCNSAHEATLLRRFVDETVVTTVIPLPVERAARTAAPADLDPAEDRDGSSIAILGFVYPGKGHEPTVRAAADLGTRHGGLRVEALGRPSAGHEGDVAQLERLAAELEVGFEVTGYLDDEAFLERCRRASVPVIAHEHVSASGSLASWLDAGRRPIVVRSAYMAEMAALHPGALTLVDREDLAGAISRALERPGSTWLDDSARLGPDLAATAESYRRFWAEHLA